MHFEKGALCLRFDIDTFSARQAFIADVGMGEYRYIPKILDTAETFGVKLQFCTCGQGLRENPQPHADIQARGHAVDSHLYTHTVTLLDACEKVEAELVLTEQEFAAQNIGWTGIGATGMYPKGICENPDIQTLLKQRGYRWCSTKYHCETPLEDMQPFWLADGLLEIPCAGMSDRHYFYDVTAPVEGYVKKVATLIEQAGREGLVYCICLHPGVLAKFDPKRKVLTATLEHAAKLQMPLLTMYELYQYERLTAQL